MFKYQNIIAVSAAAVLLVAGCGAALIGGAVVTVIDALPVEPEPVIEPEPQVSSSRRIKANTVFIISEDDYVTLPGGLSLHLLDDNDNNGVRVLIGSSVHGISQKHVLLLDQGKSPNRLICLEYNLSGGRAKFAIGDGSMIRLDREQKQDKQMLISATAVINNKVNQANRDMYQRQTTGQKIKVLEATALAFKLLDDYVNSNILYKQFESKQIQELRRRYSIVHGLFAWHLYLRNKGDQWAEISKQDFETAISLDLQLGYDADDAYSIAKDNWTPTTKTMWTIQRKEHEKQ